MGTLSSTVVVRSTRGSLSAARDVVALSKPRITLMVMLTALGGAWLAPSRVESPRMLWLVLGTALVVGGANALNMLLERDTDALMARTKDRPLPAGRLTPRAVLWFGLITSASSIPILGFGVNATTATLALLANLLYVLAYTPLKRRSHLALLVGAVPGALPPLMGWTAATASVDAGGLVLFAVLYFWQLPHFMAIALFRREDYERAGLVIMPSVRGEPATRRALVRYIAALVAASAALAPLHVVGAAYLPIALGLGGAFLIVGLADVLRRTEARATFHASLVYLVALFVTIGFTASR